MSTSIRTCKTARLGENKILWIPQVAFVGLLGEVCCWRKDVFLVEFLVRLRLEEALPLG